MRARLGSVVRGAPLTVGWLGVLFVTTVLQRSMSSSELHHVLGDRSTNLANLSSEPLRVLFTSLFWIDGAFWLPYLLLFCIFHIPAERWLGSLRWLAVGLSAHVLATYISEGALWLAIRDGVAKDSMVNTLDVGVSYFLAGIMGVLAYHIARPWRWLYLAGVLGAYGIPLLADVTFTEIGHFASILIGLLACPIVRGCAQPWDPMDTVRAALAWYQSDVSPSVRHRNS